MSELDVLNATELKILDYLKERPSGSTITDISNDLELHRNTVSKYISRLNEGNYIKIKEFGRYKMCYSTEKRLMPKKTFMQIYKGILHGLKRHFPNQEQVFKKIGTELMDYYPPEATNLAKIINELKNEYSKIEDVSLKTIIQAIEDIYYSVFFDSIKITKIELFDEGRTIKIQYGNTTFLKSSDNFIYHIYMFIGYIEALLRGFFDRNYVCSVVDYHVSDDNLGAYVNLLIQIIRD